MPQRPEDSLMPREFEAAALLARDGGRDADIGRELEVSVETVKRLLAGARVKAGVETRGALIIWFREKFSNDELHKAGYIQACMNLATARGKALSMARARRRIGK